MRCTKYERRTPSAVADPDGGSCAGLPTFKCSADIAKDHKGWQPFDNPHLDANLIGLIFAQNFLYEKDFAYTLRCFFVGGL